MVSTPVNKDGMMLLPVRLPPRFANRQLDHDTVMRAAMIAAREIEMLVPPEYTQ